MQLLSIQIPEAYITGIDMLVLSGYFPNRSEAIRSAVRDLIKSELGGFQTIRDSYMLMQAQKSRNGINEDMDEL
jgi:Arc/MetJ-type ribon-helix-helix transcriptional regulator